PPGFPTGSKLFRVQKELWGRRLPSQRVSDPSLSFHDILDLLKEFVGRQGFCEEIETRLADALVGQDVSRISARKEDLDIGLERPDLIDYLYAVLPGHDDVNDDEIDAILV